MSPGVEAEPKLSSRGRWRAPQTGLAWVAIGCVLALPLLPSPSGGGDVGGVALVVPADEAGEKLRASGPGGLAWSLLGLLVAVAIPAGLVLFVQALRRACSGRWKSRVGPPKPWHGYHVEAFALWLVLGIPAALLIESTRGWVSLPAAVVDALLHPLGLLALLWPLWRGVTWAKMSEDLGFDVGQGVRMEVGAGVLGLLAKLPLLALGMAATLGLLALAGIDAQGPSAPVHPIARFGQVDVWVNNAGRGINRLVSELTDEDVDEMMLVNVKAALYGIQAVLPHFRARGRGHVINVSSMLGRVPLAGVRSAYSASKHALNSLTANLRMELRASDPGISVSSVHPGVVATEFGLRARHGGMDSRNIPGAQPVEEVARVILDVIEQPRADVYTRPGAQAMVVNYYAAEDMGRAEQEPPFSTFLGKRPS